MLIEQGPTSYEASVPDPPGCVAVADTREEVEALIKEAIEFHLEGMRDDGKAVPAPSTTATVIDVAA